VGSSPTSGTAEKKGFAKGGPSRANPAQGQLLANLLANRPKNGIESPTDLGVDAVPLTRSQRFVDQLRVSRWSRAAYGPTGLPPCVRRCVPRKTLVRHGSLEPATLWEINGQQLKKSGLVSLHRGTENFDQLGGLENLKAFCLRAMRRQGEPQPGKRPRGVLLLSPPGCGKSQFAKALGNETGRPTVILDIGNLLGSLVGQSESNVRQARELSGQYEQIKSEAQRRLGTLFNASDYPTTLDGMFDVEVSYPPIEPPHYLIALNPGVFEAEQARVRERFESAVELAEQAFAGELQRLVTHLAERLTGLQDGQPKVFRDSCIDKATPFL